MDGEPRYEDHSISWRPANGWFQACDVRQAAYWALVAGAHGEGFPGSRLGRPAFPRPLRQRIPVVPYLPMLPSLPLSIRWITHLCVGILTVLSGPTAIPLRAAVAPPDPLITLRLDHPRLLASQQEWDAAGQRIAGDAALEKLSHHLIAQADVLLKTPPNTRQLTGRRLLSVSRNVLQRILQLVTAYHLTGREAYARRAEQEMLAVAAFADWNPSHFLDSAEMTAAVAIGLDELHDQLAPATRSKLTAAIARLGLRPGLDPSEPHNYWHQSDNNWNQVCWGGLTLGALAVAETEPVLARKILTLARANIARGLQPYAPDGLHPEGPGYWTYGTSFQVLMIEALRHALGDDWGMPGSPGFLASASALTQITGPTGLPFNFSDGGEIVAFPPALFWFARELTQPTLLAPHHAKLEAWLNHGAAVTGDRFAPLALLWWPRPSPHPTPALPLAWQADGEQPVAVFRSAWDSPDATYLATKGGSAAVNHAHMDAGSFVFESDGERWVRDLGSQPYDSLESKGIDLWNRSQESDRWRVFRLNNRSHNTLVIDDQLQRVDGHATVARLDPGDQPLIELDLTDVYRDQASTVRRAFRLDRHQRVLMQDELSGLSASSDVRWAMVTGARIELSPDGRTAWFRSDEKSLRIEVLAPQRAHFESQPADPPQDDFNVPNPDRRMLLLHLSPDAEGNLRITVLLTPGSAPALPRPIDPGLISDW